MLIKNTTNRKWHKRNFNFCLDLFHIDQIISEIQTAVKCYSLQPRPVKNNEMNLRKIQLGVPCNCGRPVMLKFVIAYP